MKYLQLTVREPPASRNPMHEFLIESDDASLAQLWNWSTTPDEIDVVLFRVVGDREAYTAALDEAAFVVDYATARLDDESFYAYVEHATREEDAAFREPFLHRRVLTIPPIEFTDDGETRMDIIGRPADAQAVVDEFPAEFDVRVEQISTYEQGLDVSASLLTERQREAVAVAVDLGYYDVPRTATVADVAAELGCASSTASSHLQKAHAQFAHKIAGQPL
ncbi:helix-turn-helix domain-containing protein [Halobellus rufus]|uniref:helix-turn-helix domain-containing protein n=1 Tax=Halobellus rufus TaxID=1448860 RepID=UPI000678CDB5|nr:helix-turn-helix domain-containing protein [Halobellus rufus]